MKKKLVKRKIELQAYIDFINSHVLYWINNGTVSSGSAVKDIDFYEEELKNLNLRLDEIRIAIDLINKK